MTFSKGDRVVFRVDYMSVKLGDTGTVSSVELIGKEALVHVRMDEGKSVTCWERRLGKRECGIVGDVKHDVVNNPKHYTSHPSGVECIQITEHMNFNLGNALKYIWRADLKDKAVEDLQKAEFYIKQELKRLDKQEKV
tara:strand:- start:2996 stop:3409 length:414 start_codon:yes stop_codon:yes gene_type:complete